MHTYVSVLKPDGHALTTLTPADFEAEVGGKRAQVATAVLHVPDHRVLVLLDHSGSMAGDRWNLAIALARDLVRMLPAQMPVGVDWFDDDVHQLAPLTHDHKNVDDALGELLQSGPAPKGRTRIFDSIHNMLKMLPTHRSGDIIYILTDGGENRTVSTGHLAQELSHSSTRLFAGVVPHPAPIEVLEQRWGAEALEHVAQQSGGSYFVRGQDSAQVDDREFQLARNANFAMFQSMVGDYELTLTCGFPLTKAEKLRLRVHPKESRAKIKMVYPEAILPSCP